MHVVKCSSCEKGKLSLPPHYLDNGAAPVTPAPLITELCEKCSNGLCSSVEPCTEIASPMSEDEPIAFFTVIPG